MRGRLEKPATCEINRLAGNFGYMRGIFGEPRLRAAPAGLISRRISAFSRTMFGTTGELPFAGLASTPGAGGAMGSCAADATDLDRGARLRSPAVFKNSLRSLTYTSLLTSACCWMASLDDTGDTYVNCLVECETLHSCTTAFVPASLSSIRNLPPAPHTS